MLKPRSYMAIEAGVMSACGGCAGAAARDAEGHLTCALPEQVPENPESPEPKLVPRPLCPLPAILAELRSEDPRREGVRENLAVVATDIWLLQHAKSGTEKLPACVEPKAKKVTEGDDHAG